MGEKTSHSISLTWDAPPYESRNGIISQYVIRILEDDTSTTTLYYSNTTNTTVFGLHPYYIYKCSVAAATVDIGPYTAITTLRLDEDSKSLLKLSGIQVNLYTCKLYNSNVFKDNTNLTSKPFLLSIIHQQVK